MKLSQRVPVSALAGRVRTVWVQRTEPLPCLQRNLTTGGVELHCPIGELFAGASGPDAALEVLNAIWCAGRSAWIARIRSSPRQCAG